MKNLTIVMFVLFMGLVGCASNPQLADDRADYIQDTREKLTELENDSSDFKADKATDVRASINDARAELRALETASASEWSVRRDKVNSRLNQVEQKMRRAE